MPKVERMFTRHAKLCGECDRPLTYDSESFEWYCAECDDPGDHWDDPIDDAFRWDRED